MAFRQTDLGQLVLSDPPQARAAIEALLRRHADNAVEASREAGVSYRTFSRWLLQLEAVALPVRRGEGRPRSRRGRPPRGLRRERPAA